MLSDQQLQMQGLFCWCFHFTSFRARQDRSAATDAERLIAGSILPIARVLCAGAHTGVPDGSRSARMHASRSGIRCETAGTKQADQAMTIK
jgi:hypothetical protein